MTASDRTDVEKSAGPQIYTARLDDDEPTALAIVNAVSRATKREPLELEPLSAQIDPEALEDLVSGPIGRRDSLRISFRFAECTVVVSPPTIHVEVGEPSGA